MIKKAVSEFKGQPTEANLGVLLSLLKNSNVWVPCNAVLSDMDQIQMEKMVEEGIDVGDEFTNVDPIRMVPDILQNDGKLFFPVFTSEEEMGTYGEAFSKMEVTMQEAIRLAEHNENRLEGIVLNAFTQPFILPEALFDFCKK